MALTTLTTLITPTNQLFNQDDSGSDSTALNNPQITKMITMNEPTSDQDESEHDDCTINFSTKKGSLTSKIM